MKVIMFDIGYQHSEMIP